MIPLCTHMCPYPFFEATPPGFVSSRGAVKIINELKLNDVEYGGKKVTQNSPSELYHRSPCSSSKKLKDNTSSEQD